jgi:hypothetical protein
MPPTASAGRTQDEPVFRVLRTSAQIQILLWVFLGVVIGLIVLWFVTTYLT